jgi:hypothetical protein
MLDMATAAARGASEDTVSEGSEQTPHQPCKANVGKRLQQTIDVLCEDAARTELWTCALTGFAQPVPDYDSRDNYRLPAKPDRG